MRGASNPTLHAVGSITGFKQVSESTISVTVKSVGKMSTDGSDFEMEIKLFAPRRSVKDFRLGDLFQIDLGQTDTVIR